MLQIFQAVIKGWSNPDTCTKAFETQLIVPHRGVQCCLRCFGWQPSVTQVRNPKAGDKGITEDLSLSEAEAGEYRRCLDTSNEKLYWLFSVCKEA